MAAHCVNPLAIYAAKLHIQWQSDAFLLSENAIVWLLMQEPGSATGGSTAAAGDHPNDDLDEEAIWQEVQRRQREEERTKAEAAAAATSRQQPAAAAKQQQSSLAVAPSTAVDIGAVQSAAAARLPAEPAEGAASSCRVAFRLPDGSRVQRRFSHTDTIAALQVRSNSAHQR